MQDVLYPALQKAHGKPTETPGAFAAPEGAELIEAAVLIDQTPIGRTTRSNPASYVGAFDEIRARFAAEPESKLRRYTAGTFSFNSGNGRCPACGGNGFEHIEMQFLSDVYLRCGDCNGRRYRAETLQMRIAGADGAPRQHRRGAGPDRHRSAGVLCRSARPCARGCSRWWTSAWTTCASASRCRPCRAAKRSG